MQNGLIVACPPFFFLFLLLTETHSYLDWPCAKLGDYTSQTLMQLYVAKLMEVTVSGGSRGKDFKSSWLSWQALPSSAPCLLIFPLSETANVMAGAPGNILDNEVTLRMMDQKGRNRLENSRTFQGQIPKLDRPPTHFMREKNAPLPSLEHMSGFSAICS